MSSDNLVVILNHKQAINQRSLIMSIEQAVVEKLKTLPVEKQQEVLDFVEFLQSKTLNNSHQNSVPASVMTLAQQYIGCVEGAEDLSTNQKYMEGYGA